MNARLTLGVAIPQTFPDGRIEPRRIQSFVQRAEALGFHSAWVVEHTFGAMPALAPIELLTYAAAMTERLRLGAAVLLTALRTPVQTAKSLATLDQLSGGRLIVGVGLGGNPKVYPAFGLTAERRAARFAEGLRVMKRLWTEPQVTLDGEFYQLENDRCSPGRCRRRTRRCGSAATMSWRCGARWSWVMDSSAPARRRPPRLPSR